MRIFVTGGTGFLGRYVVEALRAAGHSVTAMVRTPTARLPDGATPAQVGLNDPDLDEALRGHDAVIHIAGKVSRSPKDSAEMYALHLDSTRRLLDAMARAEIKKLVLASTSGTIAISDEPTAPMNEDHEPKFEIIGRWPYYASKQLQEQEVLRRHARGEVDAIIINPSLLLGPGDEKLSSSTDVLNVLNGRVPAYTEGTVAFVDVRDCAPVFVRALDAPSGKRYLLNGANMKVRQFIERITRAGDVAPPRFRLSRRWAVGSARVMEALYDTIDRVPPIDPVSVDMGAHHWACDTTRARQTLGFTTRDPQVTLIDTVKDLARRGLFHR